MEPCKPTGTDARDGVAASGWRKRCAPHGPSALRVAGTLSVPRGPRHGHGLQAGTDGARALRAAAARRPYQPLSAQRARGPVQRAQPAAADTDDHGQDRLAEGRHPGAVQGRPGQAQGVRFPQDTVPAGVQAQDVPDRNVLQVPADRQADEVLQAAHDTADLHRAAADHRLALLRPDGRRRAAIHPRPHNRLPDGAGVRARRGHRCHRVLGLRRAHRAADHHVRENRWRLGPAEARRRRAERGGQAPAGDAGTVRSRVDRVPQATGLGEVRGADSLSNGRGREDRYPANLDQLVRLVGPPYARTGIKSRQYTCCDTP